MCSHTDYYEEDFLGEIIRKNIVSPITSTEFLYYDNLYTDKYKIKKNTRLFINSLKKRKWDEMMDDVIKIKCYICKRNISRLMINGGLYRHICFKKYI